MTPLKTPTIVTALLAGGVSLAMAQSGPATGGYPPVAGGSAGNPAVPGPNLRAATPSHHAARHHKKLYMSTNRTHKGSKLTPASNAKPQMKLPHRNSLANGFVLYAEPPSRPVWF